MREELGRWLRMIAAGATVSAIMGLAEAGVRANSVAVFRDDFGFPASLMSVPEQPLPTRVPRPVTPLTPELRARGYNACYVPDNGFGAYTHWIRIGMGQMIMPTSGGHTTDGGYDVIVHFHGHEAVRHAFVEVAQGSVLVGIDLGNSSGPYEHAFENPRAFTDLLAKITRGLVKQSGLPNAHIRHLALSSLERRVRRGAPDFGAPFQRHRRSGDARFVALGLPAERRAAAAPNRASSVGAAHRPGHRVRRTSGTW